MSPSRRDILKAAGLIPAALARPTNVSAAPEFDDVDDGDMPVDGVTIDCVMVSGSMGRERFTILRFDDQVHVTTRYRSTNGKTYTWEHDYWTPDLIDQVGAYGQSVLDVFCNRSGWLLEGGAS